jgi:maltodextrin utilization protein YvdJ
MERQRFSLTKIVINSLYDYKNAFDMFDIPLWRVFFYFVFLNMLMFLPITYSLLDMEDFNYARFGIMIEEEPPSWIPDDLPNGCVIANGALTCTTIEEFTYTYTNNDTEYTVILNAYDRNDYLNEHTIVFYDEGFDMHLGNNISFEFTYNGFEYTDFSVLKSMTQEEATGVLLDGMFQSIQPVVFLPVLLMATGALFIANAVLMFFLAALSMLFKINQSEFPAFPNMIKLFVYASTLPAFINIIIGFLGYGAFTTITYNIITPFVALFMFRQSRLKIETESTL